MSRINRKPGITNAKNKGADRPAHTRSPISAFVICDLDRMIHPYSFSRFNLIL